MKIYVVIAALIVAFAVPALAGSGAYYIGLRLGSVSCTIMTHEPSSQEVQDDGEVYDEG